MERIFQQPEAFAWDIGNSGKNFRKHRVTDAGCEEVFFDPHKRLLQDIFHSVSAKEPRHILIGKTRRARILFLVFTIRKKKIRVISARDLNRKEQRLYSPKKR